MGVDNVLLARLFELSSRFQPKGRTLMLGRQTFSLSPRNRRHAERWISRSGLDISLEDYEQEDGYSETLMRKLGFGEMETMDFSDFEGAGIVHDLNTLPPKELEEQFDLIFDGGTIEHVFNIPNALECLYRMLKPGGRIISANGLNGWLGHGLYQFNPDLVWSFWARACNCNVLDCRAIPEFATKEYGDVQLPDPALTGVRLRLAKKIGPGRTYLYYEVEKTDQSHLPRYVLQSDYEAKWGDSSQAGETRLTSGKGDS